MSTSFSVRFCYRPDNRRPQSETVQFTGKPYMLATLLSHPGPANSSYILWMKNIHVPSRCQSNWWLSGRASPFAATRVDQGRSGPQAAGCCASPAGWHAGAMWNQPLWSYYWLGEDREACKCSECTSLDDQSHSCRNSGRENMKG